jgi:hypothetical protein
VKNTLAYYSSVSFITFKIKAQVPGDIGILNKDSTTFGFEDNMH